MKRTNIAKTTRGSKEESFRERGGEKDAFQTGGISPPTHKQGKVIQFRASNPSVKIKVKARNDRGRRLPSPIYPKLSKFLSAFFPDENEPVYLRAFPAKGRKGNAEILPMTRRKLARDSDLQKRLERLNRKCGIYFVVNAGGNSDEEIKRFNAFFAEIDDRSIEDQIALFNQALLPPSILLITKKSVHAYWLREGNCSEEEWREIQARLIAYYGSDHQIKNPSRLMRLPHFNHVSYNKSSGWQYKKVELLEFNPHRRYTAEQMREAFPAPPEDIENSSSSSHIVDLSTWDGLRSELVSRVLKHPTCKVKGVYASAKGICHDGKGDTAIYVYLPKGFVNCFNGCSYSKVLEAFGLPPSPLGNEGLIISPQPSNQAFYGLAGEIVNLIDPHTESDRMAILVQTLVLFGNVIDRTAHFRVEADNHFLNLFAIMVGDSSKGRKGTSLSQVKRLFSPIDTDWLKKRSLPGLSSGEGLIWAVRDPIEKLDPIKEKGRVVDYQKVKTDEGISDKRLLVVEAEFASTLKVLGREGNTLSPIIRQAWETGSLNTLTKNSPAQATNAHISIIGHITIDELKRYLSATEIGNGFANRFLWVYVKRSKELNQDA